jgi:hypothetical protein
MLDHIARRRRVTGAMTLALALAAGITTAGVTVAGGQTSLRAAGATGSTGATGATGSSSGADSHNKNGKSQTGRPGFENAQKVLEGSLQLRVEQLTKLSADITANATTLGGDAQTLAALVTNEQTSINGLVTSVQQATTWAELSADRKTMLVDNRVFAVMTPQVIETIEADGIVHQVQSLMSEEPGLQAAVNSVAGQPGFKNAENHFLTFVKLVNQADGDTSGLVAKILAVTPPMWPNVQHVFAKANGALLQADLDVARANYDATVIGLATGGYTGS